MEELKSDERLWQTLKTFSEEPRCWAGKGSDANFGNQVQSSINRKSQENEVTAAHLSKLHNNATLTVGKPPEG